MPLGIIKISCLCGFEIYSAQNEEASRMSIVSLQKVWPEVVGRKAIARMTSKKSWRLNTMWKKAGEGLQYVPEVEERKEAADCTSRP